MEIRDRVAIVTGASRGIGAAIATELRARGAKLVLAARDEAALNARAAPADLIVAGDLTVPAAREALVERTLASFGRVDLLVNNAGVGHYCDSIRAESTEIRALWELNFFAPLELARLAVPHMLRQPRLPGAREAGMVVNVSSVAGKVTLPWFTMYSASKFALGSWTEGLRMEYLGEGLRTLTACPGSIRTDFGRNVLAGKAPAAVDANKERFAISAAQCAHAIVRGIARNHRTVVTPPSAWGLVVAARLVPRLLERHLARLNGSA